MLHGGASVPTMRVLDRKHLYRRQAREISVPILARENGNRAKAYPLFQARVLA
jgi:hypothetical protein